MCEGKISGESDEEKERKEGRIGEGGEGGLRPHKILTVLRCWLAAVRTGWLAGWLARLESD